MIRKIKILFTLSSMCLLWSCGGSSLSSVESLLESANLKAFPKASDYPDYDYLILLDKTQMTMKIENDYSISTLKEEHFAFAIFKDVESHSFVQVKIYDGQHLVSIEARTIKPDGRIIPVEKEKFFTQIGGSSNITFHEDTKRIKFTFPSVESGDIVEYIVKKNLDYPFVADNWYFQNYVPTKRSEFILKLPAILMAPKTEYGLGWNWRFKTYNYENIGQPQQYGDITTKKVSD